MELPRGMRDIDRDEMVKIEFVRQKFLDAGKAFEFNLMEPSSVETLGALKELRGEEVRNDVYQFQEPNEDKPSTALRFDFTIGIARFVASQKTLKLPAKFSSFGGVWRYDEPQKGRYRFFHQWNIETFGNLNLEHDAELIEFTSRFFDSLKLQNISIDINHRKLVESYVNKFFGNIPAKELPHTERQEIGSVNDIFREIDKITKKPKEKILEEHAKKMNPKVDLLKQVLNFANAKGSPEEIEKSFDTSELDGWDELCTLYDSLKNRGIDNIRINFGIVRGLDYYTGIIFEAFDTTSDFGALVGGGRYDSLPIKFGRNDLGATGAAGGVERIILCLDAQGISLTSSNDTISVLYVNDELKSHAINCVSKLRKRGVVVNIDLATKSLKKQMENASGSKFSIIFAPKEFAEKNVVLRNMVDKTEKQISLDELVTNPKDVLNL
jgi:histidyl-tRNA synthetase